jgi:DNA-binding NtrC family response regulator
MGYPTEIRTAGTIIVMDDDSGSPELVCSQLKGEACYSIPCGSGAGALEGLQNARVDIVLTDIRMPGGLSGIDLLDQVHTLHPAIPVIRMTAFADIDTTVEAIKKRCFDFIIWSYKQEQLIFAIEKALKYNVLSERDKDYRHVLEEFNREIETPISERIMNLIALTVADKVRNSVTVRSGLIRQIIKEHLGDIKVKSEVGVGTVFSLSFPLRWKPDTLAQGSV